MSHYYACTTNVAVLNVVIDFEKVQNLDFNEAKYNIALMSFVKQVLKIELFVFFSLTLHKLPLTFEH